MNNTPDLCPNCHEQLPDDEDFIFCPFCGYKLTEPTNEDTVERKCPYCGHHTNVDAHAASATCEHCGAPLDIEETNMEGLFDESGEPDVIETTKDEIPAQPTPEKKKNKTILFLALFGVLLVGSFIVTSLVHLLPGRDSGLPGIVSVTTVSPETDGFPNFSNGRKKTSLFDPATNQAKEFQGMKYSLPKEWGETFIEEYMGVVYTLAESERILMVEAYDSGLLPEGEDLGEIMHAVQAMVLEQITPTFVTLPQYHDFEVNEHKAYYSCHCGILSPTISNGGELTGNFDIYSTMIVGNSHVYTLMLIERASAKETYVEDYLKTIKNIQINDAQASTNSSALDHTLPEKQQDAYEAATIYLSFLSFSRESLIEQLVYDGYEREDAEKAVDACQADWKKKALGSAKSHVEFSAYSYDGLQRQLRYEKYTEDEITYALDNLGIDWNEQALKKVEQYLSNTPFSRLGMIDQLKYEGFSDSQIQHAMDNIQVDWQEQAVKHAIMYLEYDSFSYQGLLEQLEYEQYTTEEATYGVDHCQADWQEQAVAKAKSLQAISTYSKEEMLQALESYGFTPEQAEYGASQAGL